MAKKSKKPKMPKRPVFYTTEKDAKGQIIVVDNQHNIYSKVEPGWWETVFPDGGKIRVELPHDIQHE